MIEIAVRTTILFAIAAIVNLMLSRRASAALRHSVWMLAFASVPFALLLPGIVPASVPVITVAAVDPTIQIAVPSRAADYIGLIWGTGAILLLLRIVLSYLLFRPGHERAGGPLTFGLISPEIVLPSSAANWQPALRTSVTLHEEAHIRRRDTVAQLFTQLVCALIWFQPLAWYAAWRAADERERACDDLVLNSGISPLAYAEHLVEIASESSVAEIAAIGMVRDSSLEDRLEAILNGSTRRGGVSRRFRLCSMLAATACIFGISIVNAQEKVYQVGEDGVSAPSLIHKVEPEYTQEARDAGISGDVMVSLHINKQGVTENVEVVTGLHPDLDKNSVAAVKQWRFKPAMKDGHPVVCAAKTRIVFTLR